LWWGEKFTDGNLKTLGYVIGLRNDSAGIGWRFDFDEKKGPHINQVYRIPGQKRWGKIYHLVELGSQRNLTYPPSFWVQRQWHLWTEMNTDNVPERITREMERSKIRRRGVW